MKFWQSSWFYGLIGVTVGFVIFFAMGSGNWEGYELSTCATDVGGNCYCEKQPTPGNPPEDRMVRQPSSTWSGLFSIFAGIGVFFMLDLDHYRGGAARVNKFIGRNPYTIIYGIMVVFLGFGAMFFHASLTRVGGLLDNLSMITFVSFVILYNIFLLANQLNTTGGLIGFLVTYLVINLGGALLAWFVDGSGAILFGVMAGLLITFELAGVLSNAQGLWKVPIIGPPLKGLSNILPYKRGWVWLICGLVAFILAILVWLPGWTPPAGGATGIVGAWCDPNSDIQGHFFWHLLAMAVVPFFLFLYLRTEEKG